VALTLYSMPASGNALKVRFLLAELGLAYETVEVPRPRPRPDWYLELNPAGGVPTLVDGDFVLSESNAILRYLAQREGRDDLYPTDLRAHAFVDRLLDNWSTLVRPALFPLELARGLFDQPDDSQVEPSVGPATTALLAVERMIADNGTMTGTFTIADMCAAPTLFRSAKLELPLDWASLPRLAAVREAVTAHPAFLAASPVR
jgi:glutathione S-transferase